VTVLILTSSVDIKAKDIQVHNVPVYEGLSIETMLEKGRENPQVANYLPDERDFHRLTRAFIANVTFTIMQGAFKTWVDEKIKERNDRVAVNNNLIIEMDPEVAEAFRSSLNISSKYCQLDALSVC
jgi:hypothetical protein